MYAELACLDGVVAPAEQTTIPVTDEGFLRGDGAFEVIRVYGGAPFLLGRAPGPDGGARPPTCAWTGRFHARSFEREAARAARARAAATASTAACASS